MIKKYAKKPIKVQAFQFGVDNIPDWFTNKVNDDTIRINSNFNKLISCDIQTLEGTMRGQHGDYIIKGVKGEIYPCRKDIFEETYEEVK